MKSLFRSESYVDINESQLREILNHKNILILDIRNNTEYKNGHIKNAKNYSLESLKSNLSQIKAYKNNEVVIYCTSGARSVIAAEMLVKNGFTKVYNLTDGISSYKGNLVKSAFIKK